LNAKLSGWFWVPIVAPLIGGVLGAWIYQSVPFSCFLFLKVNFMLRLAIGIHESEEIHEITAVSHREMQPLTQPIVKE